MMEDAITIAKYIVNRYPMTHLKLQKILYFIQAKGLLRNNQIFFDDIEAWDYGPVVPSVYHFFKNYGYYIINRNEEILLPKHIQDIVDDVCIQLHNYSAEYLVDITHKYRTWIDVYDRWQNGVIDLNHIRNYHRENGF